MLRLSFALPEDFYKEDFRILSPEQSINWLRDNGYSVDKSGGGQYKITNEIVKRHITLKGSSIRIPFVPDKTGRDAADMKFEDNTLYILIPK